MNKYLDYILNEGEVNESSLSRIWDKTQKHSCGTITTYRGSKTKKENQATNKEALNYLVGKGYSVTKIIGTYIENLGSETEKEVKEVSFFVANQKVEGDDKGKLAKDLIALGKRYDQDSVLIIPIGGKGAYLHGTSDRDDAWPGMNKKEKVGNGKYGKVSGQFISKLKGREFAFEDVAAPDTINGKRGQKILVERMTQEMFQED